MSSTPALQSVARYLVLFLDARSCAKIVFLSPPERLESPLISALRSEIAKASETQAKRLLSDYDRTTEDSFSGLHATETLPESSHSMSLGHNMPSSALLALPLRRGGVCSWLHALDELEVWESLRQLSCCCVEDKLSATLPLNAVLVEHLGYLRTAEDLCCISFPYRSL